jgi:hypothetical protein
MTPEHYDEFIDAVHRSRSASNTVRRRSKAPAHRAQ